MIKESFSKFIFSLLASGVFYIAYSQEGMKLKDPELIVLGIAQDAGAPQINCKKECCLKKETSNYVVCLGLVEGENRYLIEATPNIGKQISLFEEEYPFVHSFIDGIFITHAHIGHYSGLMYLGKESMNSRLIPTYMMPRLYDFILKNGPWSQLIETKNIQPVRLKADRGIEVSNRITIIPFLVPHRDEFSETVGYKIQGPNATVLFIPDIDKWTKWQKSISEELKKVDFALLDATFYDGKEINGRDLATIPHPFVVESLKYFNNLTLEEKSKIHFIHFNHTNPLLNESSKEYEMTLKNGYKVAHRGMRFKL